MSIGITMNNKPKVSAEYFNLLSILSKEPKQGLFVTATDNHVTTLGHNVGYTDIVVLCAAALFRAYAELPAETKEKISPDDVMLNFGIQFNALIKNLGTTVNEINSHNARVQKTGKPGHRDTETPSVITPPPEAIATTGNNDH